MSNFPKLPEATRYLIYMGSWALYRTSIGLIIQTDGGTQCCNPKPKRHYLIDEQGCALGEVEWPGGEVEPVHVE